ncbi:unnamed protein product [Caenorhabditis auriculariae]|uniref:Uncharacterized protein n=1 Tax=Caenorhabditis auriculariae TaxID=2777116 RepID=A0A8S1HZ20_9PELO|nr:unnamed protein product [Caenorhabditis auriculariae]
MMEISNLKSRKWTFFDWIAFYSNCTTTIVGIFLNIIFLILILRKSTRHLRPYSTVLLNVAVTELICSASCGFVIPRAIQKIFNF